MRQVTAGIGIAALLSSSAWAGGDLTVSLAWTAQNPAWQTSTTESGLVASSLLAAWRLAAGPNGPICADIWQKAAKLNGLAGCLRNLYTSGNVCQLDQSPTISVASTSGGVVASAAFNNNHLEASFSLQTGLASLVQAACGLDHAIEGDPRFTFTISGVANMGLTFSNNQLSVGSSTANITTYDLGGANDSAKALIGVGNIVGAFNGLKSDLAQTFNFTSQAATAFNNSGVNGDIAKVLQPLQGLGVASSIAADTSGVHLALTASKCLPGQTAGTFPCDKTTVCLNAADWAKINSESSSCTKSYFGYGMPTCQGFPGAAGRGPVPPDGWFGQGSLKCTPPSASQVKGIVITEQSALDSCQSMWLSNCTTQQTSANCRAKGVATNPSCNPNIVYTTGPCSPQAILAAATAAQGKPATAAQKACEANVSAATATCEKEMAAGSASSCASQTNALNQAKQLCSEVKC